MTSPFGDDHADERGEAALTAERAAAERQVAGLLRWQRDPEFSGAFLRRLSRRRRTLAAPQIELLRRADGNAVFVAAGEVLVPKEDAQDRATELRRGGPIRVVDVDRAGPLAVLRSPGGARRRTAQELNSDATPFNYIVPLGGVVMKAEGGPEPTTVTLRFPAVTYPQQGPPKIVAVIDTGVSLEQRSDGYLQGLVCSDNVDALDVLPGPPDGLLDAGAGHGSFVAGIVQQVAPTATVRMYKVTGPDGVCTDIDLAAAIRRAAAEGADIINLSLGTATLDDRCPPAMKAAIEDVTRDNPELLLVCAAGNDGDDTPVWPAALAVDPAFETNVVSVGGLDPEGDPVDFSGRGTWVRCSAVARGVASTYVIGTENGPLIGDPVPDTFGPDSTAIWSGTSFATPQIAGAVARLCEESGKSAKDCLAELLGRGGAPIPDWGVPLVILPGT